MAGKGKSLWSVTVPLVPESDEAVAALLERIFGSPATVYSDAETGKSTASVHFRSGSRPSSRQVSRLEQGLRDLREFGWRLEPRKMVVARVRDRDWAHSWKRHFPDLVIRKRLVIKPPWSRRKLRRGETAVVLNPSMSFGTGHHPTTQFCLEQLVVRAGQGAEQSMLDAGCGSGILAIAAAKLGFHGIDAFDFDPQAVQVAKENAARNRVGDRMHIFRADLEKMPPRSRRKYDVVCANLMADLLIANAARLRSRIPRGGALLVAGILQKQFAGVERAMTGVGLSLATSSSVGEWTSGVFVP